MNKFIDLPPKTIEKIDEKTYSFSISLRFIEDMENSSTLYNVEMQVLLKGQGMKKINWKKFELKTTSIETATNECITTANTGTTLSHELLEKIQEKMEECEKILTKLLE